jgi:hypothetical protein
MKNNLSEIKTTTEERISSKIGYLKIYRRKIIKNKESLWKSLGQSFQNFGIEQILALLEFKKELKILNG